MDDGHQRESAAAFRRKGRFNELLRRVPVRVIARNAALLGAAGVGVGET